MALFACSTASPTRLRWQWHRFLDLNRTAPTAATHHQCPRNGWLTRSRFLCGRPRSIADDMALAEHYEENLVALIKALRLLFKSPNAKFVAATLGQTLNNDTTS